MKPTPSCSTWQLYALAQVNVGTKICSLLIFFLTAPALETLVAKGNTGALTFKSVSYLPMHTVLFGVSKAMGEVLETKSTGILINDPRVKGSLVKEEKHLPT